MKKYLNLIVIAIIAIASCQKAIDSPDSKRNIDKEMSYKSISDPNASIISYNMLSPQNMYNIWYEHLDSSRSFFINDTTKYNIITDVINFLSPNVFSDTSGTYDNQIAILKYQISQTFANDTIEFLIFEYLDIDALADVLSGGRHWITMAPLDDSEGGAIPNCNCRDVFPNHCVFKEEWVSDDRHPMGGYWRPSHTCETGYLDCKVGSDSDGFGCGFLLRNDCTGLCKRISYY